VKVAVTGASGFIGRVLCGALAEAGHSVAVVDLRQRHVFAGDAVVHLAAIAHRRADTAELQRVNIQLARQVGEIASAKGMNLVFVSSVKVHGEVSDTPLTERSPIAPRDPYGESKARAEEALASIPGLRLSVLRPPLVYGPGVKANFLALLRAVAWGAPLPFAAVQNRRSLVYVANLAAAIIACLGKEGTFLLSDGQAVSTPTLCRAMGEALERPAKLFSLPQAVLPKKLAASLEVDDSAIRSALGWRPPFTFEQGIGHTARWFQGR
jgi:nucleoside-diphosphate-sugar epimerase